MFLGEGILVLDSGEVPANLTADVTFPTKDISFPTRDISFLTKDIFYPRSLFFLERTLCANPT